MTKAFYGKIYSAICLNWAYYAPFAFLTIWTCAPRNPTLHGLLHTAHLFFLKKKNKQTKNKRKNKKQNKNKTNQQQIPMCTEWKMSLLLSMSKANFDFILTVVCVCVCLCPGVSSSWCHGLVYDLWCGTSLSNTLTFWGFAGADPGFIERHRVHMYKSVGVRFAVFISYFLNIQWKWNNLVTETKLFHFHRIFKTGGGGGGGGRGFKRTPPPPKKKKPQKKPLDPPTGNSIFTVFGNFLA